MTVPRLVITSVLCLAFLTGCASAGGTAHILDLSSVYYKHPMTSDVKECGGGFYPGVQIRRYFCGRRWLDAGYVEVEKCKAAAPGALCLSVEEHRRLDKED